MNEDTQKLLKEITSGCKMAIESLDQVLEFVKDAKLEELLRSYKEKHEEIEQESAGYLKDCGCSEKEPGMMASAFSWVTAEMKLMMKDNNHQIAKLMMDGCSMGIQSISEYRNQYVKASKEGKAMADKLIHTEENFLKDLESFM